MKLPAYPELGLLASPMAPSMPMKMTMLAPDLAKLQYVGNVPPNQVRRLRPRLTKKAAACHARTCGLGKNAIAIPTPKAA
jgi:hypothetical protein